MAAELCGAQTLDGWGFDVELLYIARRRGYTIREIGIPWHYVEGSRVNPPRDTLTMVRDVLRVWTNARRGSYAVAKPGADRVASADALPPSTLAATPTRER